MMSRERYKSRVVMSRPQAPGYSAAENGARQVREVLWTGGWDSTFRVADLVLVHQAVVRPWYIEDDTRQSTRHELSAMDEIREALSLQATEGELLETKRIEKKNINRDPVVTEKFEELKARRGLGPQYQWLADLVLERHLEGIEVCITNSDRFAFLLFGESDDDRSYQLIPHRPDLDERSPESLFNLFSFPTIGLSKSDMRQYAQEHGFAEVLYKAWFCHTPTRASRPCGFCTPCRVTYSQGLKERLDVHGKVRKTIMDCCDAVPRGYRAKKWLRRKLRGF